LRKNTEAAYRSGDRKVIELFDAQKAYRDRLAHVIEFESDYCRALNKLNSAVGLKAYDPERGPTQPVGKDAEKNKRPALRPASSPSPPSGRLGEPFRINARQGDAGSLADPGVAVALCRLKRGDGLLGLFAEGSESDGGAPAHVALLVLEGLDQRRHNLGRRVPPSLRQEPNRYDPIFFFGRLEILDQLVGRFLLAAAGARQHAKRQN
jgi:hypothetical protein